MVSRVLMIACIAAALGLGACADRRSEEPEPAQPDGGEIPAEILVDGFEQGDTEAWAETTPAAAGETGAQDPQEKE